MDQALQTIRLNQQQPIPKPAQTLEDQMIAWQMQFLKAKTENKGQEVIVSGQSHTCKLPFDQLKSIKIEEMQVPNIHKGRYLICRTIVEPFASISMQTLIEDLNGDALLLQIYNYSPNLNDTKWLPLGSILLIKEPYLQFKSSEKEISLRVDSPTDLIFVDSTDEDFLKQIRALRWLIKETQNVRELCINANDYFRSENFEEAIKLYSKAIRIDTNLPQLHLNKSMAYLYIGLVGEAQKEAKLGIEKGGDEEKGMYRLALAFYKMRDWVAASIYFNHLHRSSPQNPDIKRYLKRTNERLQESRTGAFDFKTMFSEAQQGRRELDIADYKGSIEVVDVKGKGRGLVASQDIPKGTLLLVSKAFAVGYDQDCQEKSFRFVNLLRNKRQIQVGKARHKFQVIRAVDALRRQPNSAKELYELYAGDDEERGEFNEDIIDVNKVEQICLHNSFGNARLTRNKNDDEVESWTEQDATMLFLLPSYFNHSCVANAHREHYGDILAVYAVKNLQKGDEITICYVPPTETYAKRQEKFKTLWGFKCQCDLCTMDEKDGNCEKRAQLLEQFDDYKEYSINEEKLKAKGERILKQVDLAQLLVQLSCIYSNSNQLKEAIECLEEAFELTVNDFPKSLKMDEIALKISVLYSKLGETEKASEFLRRAFELSLCVDWEHFKMVWPAVGKLMKGAEM